MTAFRFAAPDQPGWSAISAGGVFALVRGDASDDVVERAREAAGSGELDDLLDALTRDGVRTAPDFVAVQEGDPVRVVARGTAYAVAPAPAGDVEIRAARRGPWADEDAPDGAAEVVLHSGVPLPEPEEAAAALPDGRLSSPGGAKGWQVPARLRRGGPPPVGTNGADGPDASADSDVPEGAVQEVPGYDYLFGAPGSTGTPPFLPNHDTGTLQEPPIGRAPMEEAAGVTPPPSSDHTLPPPQHTQAGRLARSRDEQTAGSRTAGASAGTAPGSTLGTAPSSTPGRTQGTSGSTSGPEVRPAQGGGLIESVPWRRGGSNVAPSPDEPVAPPTRAIPAPPVATPAPSSRPGSDPGPSSGTSPG